MPAKPYVDPRIIPCLTCRGMSEFNGKPCEECEGQGQIRVPTRTEREAEKKLATLRVEEVTKLRDLGDEFKLLQIALHPCHVCGRLWQDHTRIYGTGSAFALRLCPMPGSILGPTINPNIP